MHNLYPLRLELLVIIAYFYHDFQVFTSYYSKYLVILAECMNIFNFLRMLHAVFGFVSLGTVDG